MVFLLSSFPDVAQGPPATVGAAGAASAGAGGAGGAGAGAGAGVGGASAPSFQDQSAAADDEMYD